MTLYYAGRDITDYVEIKNAVHTDSSDGKRDYLDIEFESTEKWLGWQPQRDDTIEIIEKSYDTGKLYVNTILCSESNYKIIATGTKCAARQKRNQLYEGLTLKQIMSLCAAECGMESALYGASGDNKYDAITRCGEGCTAFMDRILGYEGAILKTLNGKMRGIGIEYAQEIEAAQTIKIDRKRFNADYVLRNDLKIKKVTVTSPNGTAYAIDTAAPDGQEIEIALPVFDNAMAGRWARGWLLGHNRRSEEMTITTEFNRGLTALGRIDIESVTGIAGQWIIDEVVHDFIEQRTKTKMLKCVDTVR